MTGPALRHMKAPDAARLEVEPQTLETRFPIGSDLIRRFFLPALGESWKARWPGGIGIVSASISNRSLSEQERLVLGPELDPAGIARVVESAGLLPKVDTWEEAIHETRKNYGHVFPDWSDSSWLYYTKSTYRQSDDGRLDMNLDRNVGVATREGISGLRQDPWLLFDALLKIPLLVLRGEHSDLLSTATFGKMQHHKPDLTAVTVRNRGHAPYLDEPEASNAIDEFLDQN